MSDVQQLRQTWTDVAEGIEHWLGGAGQSATPHERVFAYGVMRAIQVCIADLDGPGPNEGARSTEALANVIPFVRPKQREAA